MSQHGLATASGLTTSQISRIESCGSVAIDETLIGLLAIGLKMSLEEYNEFLYKLWPEKQYIYETLRDKGTIFDLNDKLDKNELPTYGCDK